MGLVEGRTVLREFATGMTVITEDPRRVPNWEIVGAPRVDFPGAEHAFNITAMQARTRSDRDFGQGSSARSDQPN
jgi:hypothetical protein